MTLSDLDDEIRLRLLRLRDEATIQHAVVILNKQEYNDLFWQLLHTQQSQRFKSAGINLVEQLNNYIAANRTVYPATFSVQAPVKLNRPSPPVTQQRVSDIHLIEQLDRYFNDSLTNAYGNYRQLLGRLVYSAMRNGGLLRQDLMNSLTTHLINAQPMCYKKLIWFELKGDAGEIHIWQPDKITVQLLHHWYGLREPDLSLQNLDADFYLKAFVRQSQITLPHGLRFTWLAQTITALLSLQISPYSLPVLNGIQPNLTLKPLVFYRLISQKSPPLSMIETTDSTPEDKGQRLYIAPVKYAANERQYNDQMALLCVKEISSMLRQHKQGKNNPKEPRQQHSMLAKEIGAKIKSTTCLPPALHYLLHWASVRLTSQSRWSGKLSPGTLANYLDSIAAPLLTIFAERDLVRMGVDELSELYTQLIDEGVSLAAQTKRARILRDFHIYLEITYQVSPCYLFQQYIAKGQRMEALTVDANILMPWEYRHASDFLLNTTEQQTGLNLLQAKALMVLLMLGFRCGLRRREAHYLRLQDIEIPQTASTDKLFEFATIYITPHEQRTLKTISAERRIPIGLLLNDTEKTVFADYLKTRQAFGYEQSNYLFYFGEAAPLLGEPGRPLAAESLLFEPLTTLLQRVTGDPSFRFHHLRHSFATWMLWSWQQKPNEHQRTPIAALADIAEFKHQANARNTVLHLSDNQPTRKVLHTISAMIGHSAPSMTLFHYIHSVSWLNWMELHRCASQLSREAEAELANVDVRTATRARLAEAPADSPYEGMAEYAAKKLRKHCIELNLSEWETTTSRQLGTLSSPVQFRVLDLDIYNALLRYVNYHVPAEVCAQEANIQLHRLTQAIANANYFFEQQFHATSRFEHKKRPRNHKRFIYVDGTRVPIRPVAELPALPATSRSLKIALKMCKEFHLLPAESQAEILWAARYVVTSCSVVWPQFRFYKPAILHRFLNAMSIFQKSLNVERRMRFTFVSRATLPSLKRTLQWQTWSLDDWPSAARDNRSNKDYAPTGFMTVDFMANKGKPQYCQRKRAARGKSEVQHRRRLSEYGVRFGLYLLFLVAG